MTTKGDICSWFVEAKKLGATHLLIVCDTFDWEDYPVFVMPDQDVYKEAAMHAGLNMTKLMEVYNTALDLVEQLSEYRARNF